MKKEDKALVIESLKQTIQNYSAFYLVDVTGLDSTATSDLRRKCFKSEVKMVVVKNTLLQKALDQLEADYSPLYDSLKGTTALMLSNAANAPAKLLKDVTDKKTGIPGLKAAYAEESFYPSRSIDQLPGLVSFQLEKTYADADAKFESPLLLVLSSVKVTVDPAAGTVKISDTE